MYFEEYSTMYVQKVKTCFFSVTQQCMILYHTDHASLSPTHEKVLALVPQDIIILRIIFGKIIMTEISPKIRLSSPCFDRNMVLNLKYAKLCIHMTNKKSTRVFKKSRNVFKLTYT